MPVLRVLGLPELVTEEGEALKLGGTKQVGLLARLALAAPSAVTVDHLVDDIWGDDSPDTARNTLQVYVSALRKVLRPVGGDVARSGDGYALELGPLELDVAEFTERVAAGRSALRGGAIERAASELDSALRQWRTPPLGGLDALPFVGAARTALEATRTAALADLADSLVRAGRFVDAASTAAELVAAAPYGERGWVLLATTRYHAGNQAAALEACRAARDLLADELGLDPGPELTEVERAIRAQTLAAPQPSSAGPAATAGTADEPGLPALPLEVLGRDRLIDEVLGALAEGAGLVSLVGLGGIGKTTAALTVAYRLRADGGTVAFCELEPAHDATTALELACRALGLEPGDDPTGVLASAGRGRRPVLVLDNAEHLPDLPAALAPVLASEHRPALVVTSRRALDLRGERVIAVPPLSVDPAGSHSGPAVELFLQRASEVRSGLDVTKAAPAAEELCRMLDGIPLAIELAARRVRVLTPEQLLDRIGRQKVSLLDLDATADRPDRHASLRAVLESTEALLSPAAQQLLLVIACCDGWTSLDLVETVAERTGVSDVVGALDELVTVDLVTLDSDGWLRLRAPVRQHVLDRSAHDGPKAAALVSDAIVELVESTAPTLHGTTAPAGVERLRRDYDTVSAVLARAVQTESSEPAARLALGLNRFWLLSGRLAEGRRAVSAVRALPRHQPDTAVRLALLDGTFASYLNAPSAVDDLRRALAETRERDLPADRLVVNGWCCLAAVQAHQGDLAAAQQSAEQAAAAAASSNDPALVSLARDVDGHVASYAGDFERALAATLAGIEDARRSGDRYDLVQLLVATSDELLRLGRPDQSRLLVDEAFDLAGEMEVGPLLAYVLVVRGQHAAATGESAAARGYLTEVLRLTPERYPDPLAEADALFMLASLAADAGQPETAARWWGAADVLYADNGAAAQDRLVPLFRERRSATESALGPDQFRLLAALGAADPRRTVASAAGTDMRAAAVHA